MILPKKKAKKLGKKIKNLKANTEKNDGHTSAHGEFWRDEAIFVGEFWRDKATFVLLACSLLRSNLLPLGTRVGHLRGVCDTSKNRGFECNYLIIKR